MNIKHTDTHYHETKICDGNRGIEIIHNVSIDFELTIEEKVYDLPFANCMGYDCGDFNYISESFVINEAERFLMELYVSSEDLDDLDIAEFNEEHDFNFTHKELCELRALIMDSENKSYSIFIEFINDMSLKDLVIGCDKWGGGYE